MSIPLPSPGTRFDDAARTVLDHLHTTAPMRCWAITRHDGEAERFLHVHDQSTAIAAGEDVEAVGDLACVTELRRADGRLFGRLCGVGPSTTDHTPLMELLAHLLMSLLEADHVIAEHVRAIEQAQRASELDPLTGLLNRTAWNQVLEQEEDRHRRFGDPAAVIVVDLDRLGEINEHRGMPAGDRHIVDAATAIRNTVRGADVVARISGAELGVIVDGISPNECELLADRILDAFRSVGVSASIGWAPYTVTAGFAGAVAAASGALAEDKRQRRTRAGRLVLVR